MSDGDRLIFNDNVMADVKNSLNSVCNNLASINSKIDQVIINCNSSQNDYSKENPKFLEMNVIDFAKESRKFARNNETFLHINNYLNYAKNAIDKAYKISANCSYYCDKCSNVFAESLQLITQFNPLNFEEEYNKAKQEALAKKKDDMLNDVWGLISGGISIGSYESADNLFQDAVLYECADEDIIVFPSDKVGIFNNDTEFFASFVTTDKEADKFSRTQTQTIFNICGTVSNVGGGFSAAKKLKGAEQSARKVVKEFNKKDPNLTMRVYKNVFNGKRPNENVVNNIFVGMALKDGAKSLKGFGEDITETYSSIVHPEAEGPTIYDDSYMDNVRNGETFHLKVG